MLEKFTERARKVIALAREEAERLNHSALDTEHILLGMIKEGNGVGIRVLLKMQISPDNVRLHIEKHIFRSPHMGFVRREIPFTDLAKKVLSTAIHEAKNMGHTHVGTEHLLLALIHEREGRAGKVLRDFRVDYHAARRLVAEIAGAPQVKSQEASRTPVLDSFSRDLTQLAEDDELDPVIGRELEMERMMQILARRTKNNPVLIGEPGVGKTAIVEGLAQKIVNKEVPEILEEKRIIALDLAALVAGTKYRGQFEERLQTVIKELKKTPNVVIFIDEIHTLVGAGAAEGSIDASNMLKPALSRGEIQCVGATTLDEYRKHIEKDGALERRFQTIKVEAPNSEETLRILQGLKHKYEAHHRVRYDDEGLLYAVKFADQYITDRNLPDKAIDVMDESGSRVRLDAMKLPKTIKELEAEMVTVDQCITEAVRNNTFEKLTELRKQRDELHYRLRTLTAKRNENALVKELPVGREDIAYVVSRWTGIPIHRIEEEETQRLLNMEENIHKRIIAQDEAISIITRAIRRSRAGLKDPRKPIGTFLFLGPTGVGKTELARALAEFLFSDEKALVRIDMSEYMEKHSISRLVGSPPGYIGYGEGGQLTEQVRRRPYSVVLLDEIEKANPDVFNLLLQVMEDGHLTDSMGRHVSFKNTVIIMTSNVGARLIKKGTTLGFGPKDDSITYDKMKDTVLMEVRKLFNPEFLNRVDDLIVFHPLNRHHLREIIDLQIARLNIQLKDFALHLTITDDAREFLLEKGYEPAFGARPIKRTIQTYVENPLAEARLKGQFLEGGSILIKVTGEHLGFQQITDHPVLSSSTSGEDEDYL
ncbi:ATP-dependent Clp protease ATP-binding subunit [bacterium]|nr:ATP-dependent Clp protease ATP-binding subunit [candidate division CSSED10-310 bacterium]